MRQAEATAGGDRATIRTVWHRGRGRGCARASVPSAGAKRSRSRGIKCTFPGRRVMRMAGPPRAVSMVEPITRGAGMSLRSSFARTPVSSGTARAIQWSHSLSGNHQRSTYSSRRPWRSTFNPWTTEVSPPVSRFQPTTRAGLPSVCSTHASNVAEGRVSVPAICRSDSQQSNSRRTEGGSWSPGRRSVGLLGLQLHDDPRHCNFGAEQPHDDQFHRWSPDGEQRSGLGARKAVGLRRARGLKS